MKAAHVVELSRQASTLTLLRKLPPAYYQAANCQLIRRRCAHRWIEAREANFDLLFGFDVVHNLRTSQP